MLKDLPELLKAEVISEETADKIRAFYQHKEGASSNRLLIVFGILGSILVGLGIILIVAHNWDNLSKSAKTAFAFLPLIIGQIFCGYALLKKSNSTTWRESTTTFLFFAIGSSISLVSQIYNIPGNLSSFLLTWIALCIPLIYIMKSSVASLLCIIGITYYACETSYWGYPTTDSYYYWVILLLIIPHHYSLIKNKFRGNFTAFHNWLLPLSLIITLGTISGQAADSMFIAYFSLFGVLILIGNLESFAEGKNRSNGFKLLGSLGTIILLIVLSFDWYWEELRSGGVNFDNLLLAPEFIASIALTLLGTLLLLKQIKDKRPISVQPAALVFLLFIITFIVGLSSSMAVLIINLAVFALGLLTINQGAKREHLGTLNYGLMMIAALVVCRFFDTDLSFVIRGILFMAVGAGFFSANYWLIKKRKTNEQ
jgi:uncharacterized membrane protein